MHDSGGHFIESCSVCKKVIKQCRCADKNKAQLWSICDECKAKDTAGQTPRT